MPNGMIQLVAYGAQDIYLTGNPQITFFKIVYRRHTNFAIESIEQILNENADFDKKVYCKINREGDLIGPITLEVDVGLNLNSMFDDSDSVGDYKWSSKTSDFKGWLKCDGRSLDKRTYSRLFAKIGYSFGGSGNNFNLPNLEGKVLAAIGTGTTTETIAFTAVNTTTETITVASNDDKWITGMEVVLTTSGSAPGGTTAGNTYYIIRASATTIQLANSLSDAVAGNNINLTSQGSGNHTITYTLSTRTLGELSGEEKHASTIAEMPSHNHTITDPGHSHNITDPGHTHSINDQPLLNGINTPGSLDTTAGELNNTTLTSNNTNSSTTGITVNSATTGITVNNTGGSGAHNNMQPTVFAGSLFIFSGYDDSFFAENKTIKDYLIRWGFQLLDYVEFEIGGQLIEKQYGEWMDIWTQLTYSQEKYEQLLKMINTSIFASTQNNSYDKTAKLYIPLQFWFNRNPGLYIPILALQYQDVSLNIKINKKTVVNTASNATSNSVTISNFNYDTGAFDKSNYIDSIISMKVFVDFVYLDTDERRRFAQTQHEYLIEQTQISNKFQSTNQTIECPLSFKHPCKTIVWRGQRRDQTFEDVSGGSSYNSKYILGNLFDFTAIGGNTTEENAVFKLNSDIVKDAKLVINNHDRFQTREGSYFRVVQPNMYTSPYNSALSKYQDGLKQFGGGFYMYSFGLKPDLHQPSGTINFSRIDKSHLTLNLNPYASTETSPNLNYNYDFYVYAVNYNVLRIMSGMAGLAYAN